jgi:hypothetical protein
MNRCGGDDAGRILEEATKKIDSEQAERRHEKGKGKGKGKAIKKISPEICSAPSSKLPDMTAFNAQVYIPTDSLCSSVFLHPFAFPSACLLLGVHTLLSPSACALLIPLMSPPTRRGPRADKRRRRL